MDGDQQLTDVEAQFLIAEYEQAWAMVLNIDERRFKFVEYYSAIAAGSLAVLTSLAATTGLSVAFAALATGLIIVAVAVGFAFLSMIRSERAANVRYRAKINLIRGILLSRDTPPLRDYLARKDVGNLVAADPQPSGIGRTLRGVLQFLYLEMAVLVAAGIAIWIGVAIGLD